MTEKPLPFQFKSVHNRHPKQPKYYFGQIVNQNRSIPIPELSEIDRARYLDSQASQIDRDER